jgi:C1A family cysteine protease
MKITCALIAAAAAGAMEVGFAPNFETMSGVDSKFTAWKTWFGKSFETETAEAKALAAFVANEALIVAHNAKGLSWTLGHNQFSDLTWDEFKATYVGNYLENPTENRVKNYDYSLVNVTAKADAPIDWRTKGAVTPVKDQAQCGSCWAFSTVAAMEGALFVSSGNLVSLSEQDLVSCDKNGDQGCNGGLMDNAFDWIKTNGICSEADYPYTAGGGTSGTCKKGCSPVAKCTGHKDVPVKDEEALYTALTSSTVAVAIEADKSAFQLYKGGVLDNAACGTQLDHGVSVVGFGTDSGKDYWNVRNSWGGSWGESGYIRMVKGKNQCGISQSASQPTGVTGEGPAPGPTPPPAPSTPTPAPAPATGHYGDPLSGSCESDEVNITITGVAGSVCSPECTGIIIKDKCPSDIPDGCTGKATCALQDGQGGKYCALLCAPSGIIRDQQAADDSCGTTPNLTCKAISGQGICTYDA